MQLLTYFIHDIESCAGVIKALKATGYSFHEKEGRLTFYVPDPVWMKLLNERRKLNPPGGFSTPIIIEGVLINWIVES